MHRESDAAAWVFIEWMEVPWQVWCGWAADSWPMLWIWEWLCKYCIILLCSISYIMLVWHLTLWCVLFLLKVQRVYYKIQDLEISCPEDFDYDDLDKDVSTICTLRLHRYYSLKPWNISQTHKNAMHPTSSLISSGIHSRRVQWVGILWIDQSYGFGMRRRYIGLSLFHGRISVNE